MRFSPVHQLEKGQLWIVEFPVKVDALSQRHQKDQPYKMQKQLFRGQNFEHQMHDVSLQPQAFTVMSLANTKYTNQSSFDPGFRRSCCVAQETEQGPNAVSGKPRRIQVSLMMSVRFFLLFNSITAHACVLFTGRFLHVSSVSTTGDLLVSKGTPKKFTKMHVPEA